MFSARCEERGREAVEVLTKEGLSPKFHQLDIDDITSIQTLKQFLLDNYGGLDILVNNAGMAFKVCGACWLTFDLQLVEC